MHSTVRERAGIAFTGGSYGESFVLADVRLSGGVARSRRSSCTSRPAGMVVVAPLPGGMHRIVATVDEAPEQPDAAYVQALLDARGPERERAVVHEVRVGFALPRAPPRRRRRTAQGACCSRATPPTCTAPPAARA